MIAISAIDLNNVAPVWSADGAKIELAAPFVSGVAALIKSKNLSVTPQEIRNTLDYNAIDLGDIGRDKTYGYGLVQGCC